MLGAEQLFGAVDGELLDVVDEADALVVARTRVAFGVLDVQVRGEAVEDSLRGVVLTSNEIQGARVAVAIARDELGDFGVDGLQVRGGPRHKGHQGLGGSVLRTMGGLMNKRKKVAWRKHRVKAKKRE